LNTRNAAGPEPDFKHCIIGFGVNAHSQLVQQWVN
jgi:hypothetical protein